MKIIKITPFCAFIFLLIACQNNKEHTALLEDIHIQNEKMIEVLEIEIEQIYYEAKDEIKDLDKIKYQPILPALKSVDSSFQHILEQLELLRKTVLEGNDHMLPTSLFDSIVISKTTTILAVYKNLLRDNGAIFHLRKEDIESRIISINNQFMKHQKQWTGIKWQKSNDAYSNAIFQNLKWKIKFAEYELTREIIYFLYTTSADHIWGFEYFPLINPKKYNVKVGEAFEAEVYVGQYLNTIDTADFILTVNGDKVNINENGKASISISSSHSGSKKLELSLFIKNSITENSSVRSSTFEYEVLPK